MANPRYADHSDDVPRKLQLLTKAYEAGNLDFAMSLAASIKDTLQYERVARPPEKPQIAADTSISVRDLPPPLARWAQGWSHCKPITLFETVGIARSAEPVDLSVRFPVAYTVDLGREVRVASLDPATKQLVEIPSQVYAETRHGEFRQCRLVFNADVAAHQPGHFLVFYGNSNAERPDYASDLQVEGAGYGLNIRNHHYLAELSKQTGQIHRLTYAREHGMELYAGGKGHGEPPDIDWGNDYVDLDHFQKLRMRNWSECPNYEVIRGPLCVQVRRWGFPHSPMHPLFTPSRMHMDFTYTFYAGQPYFLKQSRMDMVQDFPIEAMRDDEWVFSGYSFTDSVWMDTAGLLHEGDVPADQMNSLWGVGFFHRVSRDAFIALRLDHSTEGFAAPHHGGAPTLHYAGHGQLWSRYPAEKTQMVSGASFRQKNAYLLSPYPEKDAATQIQQTRHRLLNPLEIHDQMPPVLEQLKINGRPLARFGETPENAKLKPLIWMALREVKDEQLYAVDANVVDMGYVYDVSQRDGTVRVLLTMPHRGRPVYQFFESSGGGRISEGIRERVQKLPGVRTVVVDFTWYPEWTPARLTDPGRQALGVGVDA